MGSGIAHILCPVDLSPESARAFRYARQVAAWYGAEITLLHVHRQAARVMAGAPYGGPELLEPVPLTGDEREHLMDAIREFVRHENQPELPVTWLLDESLHVPPTIVAAARDLPADVIVLGTHGRSGFRRFVLGSVTEQVLLTAGTAVLAVPPKAAEPLPPLCARVLCAVDFSPASLRALECAVSVAMKAHAPLTVAHILELPPEVPDAPPVDLSLYRRNRFEQANDAMAEALEPHRDRLPIDRLLLAGRAGPEILRLAAEQQASLVVMGVSGRGAVDLMLFGSVAQHVLRRTACPVLTMPPARRAAAL